MKYFMILLFKGKVIDVCRYDEIEARDDSAARHLNQIGLSYVAFDEVQTLDQVD